MTTERKSIEDIRREFDCIVGYDVIKEEMVQICDIIINREHYSRLGAEIPHGLLLLGEPGVGKTTMAECIVRACGRQAYRLRKQEYGDKFIERIKSTFAEAAENTPSVILLDDIDKYSSDNGIMLMFDESPAGTETEYAVIQSCIDETRDKDVFLVATGNTERDFPESLIRSGRFDRIRTVNPPGVRDAELILSKYLGGMKLAPDVDFGRLAIMANGSSCAYIEAIANDAGVLAGYERSPEITMDHIARTYLRWYSGKSDEKLTPEARRWAACHEAGHVVVMEHLKPGVMDIVSARRDLSYVDMTMSGLPLRADEDRNRLAALKALGGKAAIELVYGESDGLSENDIATAYHCASDKVRNGFDEYMHLIQSSPCEGSSEAVLEEVEDAIGEELAQMYSEALEIVAANREYLERLTEALCTNDYLLAADIQRLKHDSGDGSHCHKKLTARTVPTVIKS